MSRLPRVVAPRRLAARRTASTHGVPRQADPAGTPRHRSGATIEQAAAREYVYRWHLAIKAPDQCGATGLRHANARRGDRYACVPVFGAPHPIGM